MNTDDHGVLLGLLQAAVDEPLPELAQVRAAMSLREVAAGGTVFLQGAEHPRVYGVRRGLLKLCYLDDEGTEWIKSFSCEGQYFASIAALVPGGRASFSVTALEPCWLEQIDSQRLDALAARHRAWARALHALTLRFAARKEQREYELLTLSAEGRYRRFCEINPQLMQRIPQKDLARHLGVTPVGLNRIVMRVRREP